MTSNALTALIALVGTPRPPERLVPQETLEAIFGTSVPADYGRYVRSVPPGVYRDTLSVLQPDADGSTTELEAALEFRRGLLRDDGAPEYLVPWAAIGTDYVVCWIVEGDDPDTWRTAVFDPFDDAAVHPFDGGCVGFLLAFAAGTTGLDVLDYVYEHDSEPLFVSFGDPAPPSPAQLDPLGWSRLREVLQLPMEPIDAGPMLRELLAAASGRPVAAQVVTDWEAITARLGSLLPADYRRLVDAGVAGRIGPVWLATPGGDLDLVDLPRRVYAEILVALAERGGMRGPYHPEPGGLVPFGLHDDGSILFWNPLDADPDRWPVSMIDAGVRGMVNYRKTATAVLLGLLTDDLTPMWPSHQL
jgi:hypothetical protein